MIRWVLLFFVIVPGAFAAQRNLFRELLGKSEAETDAKIQAAWKQYFEGDEHTQRLYFPVGPDEAYIAAVGEGDVRTEGMSYGMMIAVQLDRREEFDRLWKWARTRMYHKDGPRRGYFAWHCRFDGTPISGVPASDGEEWFVTALFFAAHRWGDGEGIFAYSREAQALLREMLHKPRRGADTAIFNRQHKQVVFCPIGRAATITNPSYHLPHFYELWARWAEDPADRAFWAEAAKESRQFFRRAAHPVTGLMPERANFDGTPVRDRRLGAGKDVFAFDAWRTLSNVALDYAWGSGDEWEVEQSNRVLRFFASEGANLVNQYTLDGRRIGDGPSPGLIAMAAVAGLAAEPELARPFVQQLWEMPLPTGRWRYYNGLLTFLGLLQVSGRFQVFDAPAAQSSLPFVSPVFGDNMVLQRGKPNTIWGWAKPGEKIRVTIAGNTARTVAGRDGRWETAIQPPPAGGPYKITVDGPQRVEFSNVLVGDVWLCGGQSNMEMPVSQVRNAAEEIQAADHPQIRLYIVERRPAYAPVAAPAGRWKVCSPQTVGNFSAVAYYFGARLHRELRVPIGLVQSCVGGTPAESWTSAEALRPLKDFDAALDEAARLRARGGPEYGNFISHWYDEFDVGQKNNAWFAPGLDDRDWRDVTIPGGFAELGVPDTPAVCYFRKTVVLPDPLPVGQAKIHLGVIERMDTTQINGRWVGASAWVENPRVYRIGDGILRPGTNVIVVRVFKTRPDGGFKSAPEQLKLVLGDNTEIPLAGAWKGKLSVDARPPHPLPAGYENWPTMPGVLYNGMIAPLAPLAISGAIWYQGESNVGRAAQYRRLLPAMIADWRRAFRQGDFPFYIVSLAAFLPRKDAPGDDAWAELREAQAFVAATVTNCALAIAIDKGDAADIHPKDKREVGERLARCALGQHYRKKISYRGPTLRSVEKLPGALKLHFDHADGGLVVKGDKLEEFAVAGNDGKWVWADARIERDAVVVSSPEVAQPVAARYAWQANPKATLYNAAGLPAVPFRTDVGGDERQFPLVLDGRAAPIRVDGADDPGVLRAAGDLQADIERVTGIKPEISTGKVEVIVGTLGRSAWIDQLAKAGKIDAAAIAGKWESFLISTVEKPLPGVDRALVIAGSDRRGTIYGIYTLSEQIGVSPWYWWADVPVKRRENLLIPTGTRVVGPPAVKYRGIFINDEEPALGGWAREKFGGVNSKMYAHMFELMLRLRANYLWPAMWGKSFAEDDPKSPQLAHEYGIVVGTSHHEPMMRAHVDWSRHGKGPWNYATNEAALKEFWEQGIVRNKNFETIITIGMRGDGDEPMVAGGDMAANVRLLEKIVEDQRAIIAKHMGDPTKVPQIWALYKEVMDYYEHGMRVPEDVTLLWCDDNWGNIRRLPTPDERKRPGGAGIYYHFDYVGGPRNYKWINTNPLPKVWEQMNLAYHYGATNIWIVNVGDLKPVEVPMEFFLRMAWDPASIQKDDIAGWTRRWAEREFGPEHAAEIADLVSKYAKYNGWRKPELLAPDTFSLIHYREAERVLAAWNDIAARAEKLYRVIPAEQRDAFYQLVLYPCKAGATVVDLYIAAGRNRLFAKQGRASANAEANRVRELFKLDQTLSDQYNHELAGGKWNHMMDQTRIGYTSWQQPDRNIMPKVAELTLPDTAEFGVAVEGSEDAWPGSAREAALPTFDSINRQRSYIEVFARGSRPIEFKAVADQPWIVLSEDKAPGAGQDRRLWVDIDWDRAPAGESRGAIAIGPVSVKVTAIKATEEQAREASGCFGGLTGPIAFFAEAAARNVPVGNVRWEKIPDYGRGPSAMTIFPVTADSVLPPASAPRLEYPVYIAKAGPINVDVIIGPTLNFVPGRGLRLAVSFDDEPPQVLDAFAGRDDWNKAVADNARVLRSTHAIEKPGKHTLKITMVDPAVVLQKVIVYENKLPPSYFGPPANDF